MVYISRPLNSIELKRYYNSEFTAPVNYTFGADAAQSHANRNESDSHAENSSSPTRARAAWDFTFSAPKTVSITALLGKDERIREAHRNAVQAAITEGEQYVQAKTEKNQRPQSTKNWIAAVFDHDTVFRKGCYPGPHLHTHVVVMNMTRDQSGQMREISPYPLFKIGSLLTAIYQSELSRGLCEMGYELEQKGRVMEIKGYSEEYLNAVNIPLR